MKYAFTGIILLLNLSLGFSQCCSTGSPVAGVSSVGIVEKNNLRTTLFYKHGFSDSYYAGNHKLSNGGLISHADFNYLSLFLGYGIANHLCIETELGYFLNKTQHYNLEPAYILKGFGLNNGVASLKYNIFQTADKNIEYTAGAGVKFPFNSTPQTVKNVQLPVDIQPSTHAWGTVFHSFLSKKLNKPEGRIVLVNRFEMNLKDKTGYQFGNVLYSSLYLCKPFLNAFTAVIQFRNEWKFEDKMNSTDNPNTGSNNIYFSPQISYRFQKKWNLSALFDIPVYRYYNGTQLGTKYAFAFTLMREFVL
jgi:hypothetical protein